MEVQEPLVQAGLQSARVAGRLARMLGGSFSSVAVEQPGTPCHSGCDLQRG